MSHKHNHTHKPYGQKATPSVTLNCIILINITCMDTMNHWNRCTNYLIIISLCELIPIIIANPLEKLETCMFILIYMCRVICGFCFIVAAIKPSATVLVYGAVGNVDHALLEKILVDNFFCFYNFYVSLNI